MLRLSALVVMVLCLCCVLQEAKAAPVRPLRPFTFSEMLGVNAQFLMFDDKVVEEQVKMLKALNLKWVRLGFHWAILEPTPGEYRYMEALDRIMAFIHQNNLESVVSFVGAPKFASSVSAGQEYFDRYPPKDPEQFAQKLVWFAKRYPEVRYWQVWNEENIPFWLPEPDARAYAHLVNVTSDAAMKEGIGHKIMMGGMAYYSQIPSQNNQLMLPLLADEPFMKRVSIADYHPYSNEPEGDPDEHDKANFITRAQLVNSLMRSKGIKEIWADEFGWSTYPGPVVVQPLITEDEQADYLLRRIALMMCLDYDKIFYFTLSDLDERADPRDRFYGLLRRDGSAKPAYTALKNFLGTTGNVLHPADIKIPVDNETEAFALPWRRDDGKLIVFVWSLTPRSIEITGYKKASLLDPVHGTSISLPLAGGKFHIPLVSQLRVLTLEE